MSRSPRKAALVAMVTMALVAAGAAQARSSGGFAERLRSGESRAAPPDTTLAYGADPLQRLDLWQAPGDRPAPLVMFVHGGGWQRGSKDNAASRWAPTHFPQQGYAYAAIDYRLVPAASVEQQGEDIAHALRALLDRASELGIDRRRVVLMGHSAGAHLVALVGTDARYLQAAGLGFADVDGVIANDGAAYDVPAQVREGGPRARHIYEQAFGTDPVRQRALSPVHQAAAPNVAAFLLLHVQRPDGVSQAQALGRALTAAGTTVEFGSFPGTGLQGHAQINRELGNPDYPATAVVDAWLAKLFRR